MRRNREKRARERQVAVEGAELILAAGDKRLHSVSAHAAQCATKKDDVGVSH